MIRLLVGHVLTRLAEIPDESIHCCVTSPPYYGLRDYGIEPQVWGGEPACKHEWGNEQTASRSPYGADLVNPAGYSMGTKKREGETVSQGSFCRQCNAWRGSLGLEPTLALYLNHMLAVCRSIRRVLRKDGTLWLNIGDSYAGSWGNQGRKEGRGTQRPINAEMIQSFNGYPIRQPFRPGNPNKNHGNSNRNGAGYVPRLKPKDLMLIPSRLAIALQDDGWWVRSEIVWAKDAPMPESVTDRPTSAHEKIFLLTKSARYYYDAEAVKEPLADERMGNPGEHLRRAADRKGTLNGRQDRGLRGPWNQDQSATGRNLRNVWRLPPSPFPDAHFATFPPELPRRCIKAGTSDKGVCPKCGSPWERIVAKTHQNRSNAAKAGTGIQGKGWPTDEVRADHDIRNGPCVDTVTIGWRPTCSCNAGNPSPATILDPFAGSGTTLLAADQLQRNGIGIELNASYAIMAANRAANDAPLFTTVLTDNILQPQLL